MKKETNNSALSAYPKSDLEAMRAGDRYTKWILSYFRPWLKGTVCEVGAGNGKNLNYIRSCDPSRILLLEPDLDLYRDLSEVTESDPSTTAVNNTLAGFTEENESDGFDSVLYVNVLEHIEDDVSELRRVHSCLKPGGTVLIFVPALPCLFSAYDRKVGHWRRYTKRDMQAKIEEAGFRPLEIRYFDFVGAIAWFFMCKLLRIELSSGSVGLYDNTIVPLSTRIERILPPFIGKNLLVVAQK